MITVTKLNSRVYNKDLKVLGYDGNLYESVIGNYLNTLHRVGGSIISEELDAIKTFISSGHSNGWIQYVKYLLPFIGGKNEYLSGIVPLIDTVDDYNLSLYNKYNEDFSSMFEYDSNNRIKRLCYEASNLNFNIPIKSSDMENGITFMTSLNYVNLNDFIGKISYMAVSNNTDGETIIGYRANCNVDTPVFDMIYKNINPEGGNTFPIVFLKEFMQEIQSKGVVNLFLSHRKINDELHYTRYISNSENSKTNYDSLITGYNIPSLNEEQFNYISLNYAKNFSGFLPRLFYAFLDPNIPKDILLQFDKDIHILLKSLGRN